jgi:hypothetical protein
MKMKNDVAVIIILLLICFIVIPILSRLFVQEGFYNMNTIEVNRVLKSLKGPNGTTEFNAEAMTKNKDRVDVKAISDFILTKEDRPGQDISYNFCLGKLKCDASYEMRTLPFKDNDKTNLYYPYCISGNNLKELQCEGGVRSITKEGEAFDVSGFTPNYSFNRYQTSDNPFYFKQYDLNADKTGLKWVKNLLECDFITDSQTRVACTNAEAQIRDGAAPTNGIDANYLKDIFKALTDAARDGNTTSTSNSTGSKRGSGEAIKCIADFGTKIGDDLCCGQTGVLQDTKYTCPNTLPYCSDFKCGSKFGTCRK